MSVDNVNHDVLGQVHGGNSKPARLGSEAVVMRCGGENCDVLASAPDGCNTSCGSRNFRVQGAEDQLPTMISDEAGNMFDAVEGGPYVPERRGLQGQLPEGHLRSSRGRCNC